MPRVAFTLLLFFFPIALLFAQITIETERDSEQAVSFFAVNPTQIPYSVILNFSQLQNMTTPGGGSVTSVASPGRTKVATLRPTLAGQGSNYQYSFSYAKGNVFGKTKIDPIYLIPVPEGIPVKAFLNTNLATSIGKETSESYVGISFIFEKSTEIVAPRKGVIGEMKMDYQPKKENLNYTSEENYIEIYHEDGTITRLTVLKQGSEKVKVGDVVLPGQVLAESSGESYQLGPHVRMINQKTVKDGQDRLKYSFFPVVFASTTGNAEIKSKTDLVSAHPKEVVSLELSKKELKELAGNH